MDKKNNPFSGEQNKIGGVKVKTLNIVLVVVTIVVSVVLLIANYISTNAYVKYSSISDDYIEWDKNADKMQNASDYLTEQVRAYATTGDIKYLNNYFTESKEDQNREIALQEIERHTAESGNYQQFDKAFSDAYKNLALALTESRSLMLVEYRSMYLMASANGQLGEITHIEITEFPVSAEDASLSDDGKIEKAREILFDANYETQKLTISTNIKNCLNVMSEQYISIRDGAARDLEFMFRFEQTLVVVFVVSIIVIVLVVMYSLLVPLVRAIEYLKENKPIPVKGAYEYRYISDTYNKILAENNKREQALVNETLHDALTGIYNRREFKQILARDVTQFVAIIVFDIDHFKMINDVHGHDVGDVVLVTVSKKIEEKFADFGYVCRIGGDEIAVLISDGNISRDEICERAASINAALAKSTVNFLGVTVSVGIAFLDDETSPASLLKHADRALYVTKQNGRNGYTVYNKPKDIPKDHK